MFAGLSPPMPPAMSSMQVHCPAPASGCSCDKSVSTEERAPPADLPVGDQAEVPEGVEIQERSDVIGIVGVDDEQGSRGAIGQRTTDHDPALFVQRAR